MKKTLHTKKGYKVNEAPSKKNNWTILGGLNGTNTIFLNKKLSHV